MRLAVACLLAVLALPAQAEPPAPGALSYDRGDLALEFAAQVRSIFTYTRDIDAKRLFDSGQTTLRPSPIWLNRASFEIQGSWRDRLYGQFVYDNQAFLGSGLQNLQFQVAREIGKRTWLGLDDSILSSENFYWEHLVYRAWLRLEDEDWAVTAGRQRYSLGVGRLWTPIDLFNPIFPLAIEGDRRIGQDGVSGRYRIARGTWLRGIWSPQSDPDRHRIAALLELSRRELDVTLMAGRFERDYVFGGSFATNLKGAAARFEGTFTKLHPSEDPSVVFAGLPDDGWITQLVAGIDYTFGIGNGLYTFLEHLYNTNRVPTQASDPGVFPPGLTPDAGVALVAASQISALDRIVTTSLHTTGLGGGYDLTPLLRLDSLVLWDWSGSSFVFAPSLTWSVREDLDLSLGGQLFYGVEGDSQYGGIPGLLIVRADVYF